MIEITPIETIDGKIRAPPPQRAIPIGHCFWDCSRRGKRK